MDYKILEALRDALVLLLEARSQLEGEVALTSTVNNDLRKCLRLLRTRSHQGQQTLPQSAAGVFQATQQLPVLSTVQQEQRQTHGPGRVASTGAYSSHARQSVQIPLSVSTLTGRNSAVGSTRGASAAGQRAWSTVSRGAVHNTRNSSSAKGCSTVAGAGSSCRKQDISNGVVPVSVTSASPTTPSVATDVLDDDVQQSSSAAGPALKLPPEFKQLMQNYKSLQAQVQDVTCGQQQQQRQGVSSAASSGFLSALDRVYGGSTAATIQQPGTSAYSPRQLVVCDFAQQAEYIGLVSAALWAVQVLMQQDTSVQRLDTLQPLLAAVLQECQGWLQQQQHTLQLQGTALSAPMSHCQTNSRKSRGVDTQLQDTIRWKNRCMRGVLSAALAEIASSAEAAGSGTSSTGSFITLPGVWLPQQCWQPLLQAAQQLRDRVNIRDHAPWSVMLPSSSHVQQQQRHQNKQLYVYGDASGAAAHHAAWSVTTLCYHEVQEPVQHSRQLQKLQQLLLQLHIEAHLAPRLLQCLQDGCRQLPQGTRQNLHAVQRRSEQSAVLPAISMEQCLALYRLLYALTATAPKSRGLAGGCHIVQKEVVEDAAMLQWL